MLIAMPFYSVDVSAAERNLEWAIELDGHVKHDCILSVPRGTNCGRVPDLAKQYFEKVSLFEYSPCPWPTPKWPMGQNYAFQSLARRIAKTEQRPFFWWETDAVLLRKGAFDSIEEEYKKCHKPIMGFVWPGKKQMNGVAVYPENVSRYSTRSLLCREAPWDVVLSADAFSSIHPANHLIQRVVQNNGHDIGLETGNLLVNFRDSGCVVFHGDKRGSGIPILKGSTSAPIGCPLVRIQLPSDVSVSKWAVPVSIVLPVRDTKPEYLRECWNSILNQTCQSWELVVVDDSKNKDTIRELSRMACHPRVRIVHGTGRGLARGLNAAIGHCNAELVARMDADDIMVHDRLEKQVAGFVANPFLDVLGGNHRTFGLSESTSNHPSMVSMDHLISVRWGTTHPAAMFRKSTFKQLGGYRDTPAEDLDLWFRLVAEGYTLGNLPDVLVRYRHHDDQKSWKDDIKPAVDKMVEPYSNRKTAVFLTDSLGFGGAERWLLDFIKATCGRYKWTVLVEEYIHERTKKALELYCTVVVHSNISLNGLNPDAVLAWCTKRPVNQYGISCRVGVISHSSADDQWYKPRIERTLKGSNGVLGFAVSKTAALSLEQCGIKAKVIHLGVPFHIYENPTCPREVYRQALGLSGFVVAFVGRTTDHKGYNNLVECIPLLDGDVCVVVAGENLHGVPQEFHHPRLVHLGWVSDVPNLLNACDAYINPSQFESASYTLIESWASRCPAISTPTGYAKLREKWTVPIACDVDSIRRGIDEVRRLKDRLDLTGSSYRRAKEQFSWNIFREAALSVMDELTK